MIDERIFNRAEGFWPNSPLTDKSRRAWDHLLKSLPTDRVLDALDEYAAEGHVRPPVAGQLARRATPAANSAQESEADRCPRQIKSALEQHRRGNPHVDRESMKFYWDTYWSKHLPKSENPLKTAQGAATA